MIFLCWQDILKDVLVLLLLSSSLLFNIWNRSKPISHTKMDYLNLEKKHINWSMLINTSKINFIYILNSENKADIDYKDNAHA